MSALKVEGTDRPNTERCAMTITDRGGDEWWSPEVEYVMTPDGAHEVTPIVPFTRMIRDSATHGMPEEGA